ncbi:COP9 signalosome complex subunit 6 [Cladophialophora carrionii]|uniref:COP9 signalosome complex subunit 6 n=1 Tax=Cladophialophora carrionii TaxID=86049 RepID=A0A1C1D2I4_9EURO|nr:COP9 signalosome complex subunit 6 [Cladophialophora carrionii]
MAEPSSNPLISSRPSESGLTVSLHPLALLTVSDQVTRHSVRKQEGPVAGALLGQQRGREITVEHAFAAALVKGPDGRWQFNYEWMGTRIQQYKDVHKAPALEFVGWFALCPSDGPLPEFVSLQKQAITFYSDNAILLALHPEAIAVEAPTGGKLPITVYESVIDAEPKDEGSMQVDGHETSVIKFRPLPYSIDTDETEMIAIDYIAKGAGSAAAIDDTPIAVQPSEALPADKKGKKRADPSPEAVETKPTNGVEEPLKTLTAEEEDQIAGITTRLNSVKMLQSRLALIQTFVQSLPTSYLSSPPSSESVFPDPAHLPHLRNIQALLTRLALLTPPSDGSSTSAKKALASASLSQSNDVSLASILSLLGQDIQSLSELGRKFSTVESNKTGTKGKHSQQPGAGAKGTAGVGGGMGSAGGGFSGLGNGDGGFGGAGSQALNTVGPLM